MCGGVCGVCGVLGAGGRLGDVDACGVCVGGGWRCVAGVAPVRRLYIMRVFGGGGVCVCVAGRRLGDAPVKVRTPISPGRCVWWWWGGVWQGGAWATAVYSACLWWWWYGGCVAGRRLGDIDVFGEEEGHVGGDPPGPRTGAENRFETRFDSHFETRLDRERVRKMRLKRALIGISVKEIIRFDQLYFFDQNAWTNDADARRNRLDWPDQD